MREKQIMYFMDNYYDDSNGTSLERIASHIIKNTMCHCILWLIKYTDLSIKYNKVLVLVNGPRLSSQPTFIRMRILWLFFAIFKVHTLENFFGTVAKMYSTLFDSTSKKEIFFHCQRGGLRHDNSEETPRHWQAEIENDSEKGGRRKMHEEWYRIK